MVLGPHFQIFKTAKELRQILRSFFAASEICALRFLRGGLYQAHSSTQLANSSCQSKASMESPIIDPVEVYFKYAPIAILGKLDHHMDSYAGPYENRGQAQLQQQG